MGLVQQVIQLPPIPGAIQGQSQGLGQGLTGFGAWPKGRQLQPVAATARQSRQQTSPQQRRLARTGGAQQHQQPPNPMDAQHLESLDQLTDLGVAAEVDGRILLFKAEQPRIGRAARVPGKTTPVLQGQFAQLPGERI